MPLGPAGAVQILMVQSHGVAVDTLLRGRSDMSGLALAGFDEDLRPGRVLIFGEVEVKRRTDTDSSCISLEV